MKFKYLLALGCAALITSCTDQFDDGLDIDINKEGLEININGGIEQEYVSRVDDGGFCDGDQIGLYGVNYTDDNTVAGTLLDKGNQVDNIRYTFDEENYQWTASSAAYYKDVNTHIDLYAYYPYGTPGSTSEYEFTVQKDQNNNDGYALSDFLWAKATDVVPSENKVQLHFAHRLSGIRIVLKEGTGFEEGEFSLLKQSAIILNTKQESTINLATGVATATGAISAEGIVMMDTQEGLRAIVVPQTINAGTALFSVTLDGMTYQYKHSTALTYQPGKQTEFTMKVNRKQPNGEYEFVLTDTEIVDWVADTESHGGEARQYYVVHQEKPGTLGELIRANKKNPNKIKNLKISGKINQFDFFFMRDSMEILQAVNLKESTIMVLSFASCSVSGINTSWHTEYLDGKLTKDEFRELLQEKYPNSTISITGDISYLDGNKIPDYAFKGKKTLTYFSFPEKVTQIGHQAFNNSLLSGALIIPDDVTIIGQYAFSDTDITSLTFSNQLKEIGAYAFSYCNSIVGTLNLPESLNLLGAYSFSGCSGLSGVLHIPHQIKSIPNGCFLSCSSFTNLILPEGLETIEATAFSGCSKMNGELILPQSIKEIGSSAFSHCGFQGELIIPDQIKIINNTVFQGCDFSSILLPNELIKIERQAFSDNQRLCEPLNFPESLLSIGESAFFNCRILPKITLPSQLATIQSQAFYGCYSLSSITSNAKTPPAIINNAFYGVAKDNFTVEVPEASVVKYQTADGWSEFKFGAHHNFSISRSTLRTLNAEYSDTYILRVPSGQSWSIQNKPDWVTVSPESGTGKTDVTITVNQMADTEDTFVYEYRNSSGYITTETYNGRAGEIVFLLDEKNYTSTMRVEQYNYGHGDGEVITHQTATVGDGVNIVFMGDCFDARDIAQDKYTQAMEEAIGYFFAVEPYKSYQEYFNVYSIVGMSPESGVGTVNTIKDVKFGSQYSLSNGIVPDVETVYEYACKAETITPENIHETLVVLIENTDAYGGLTYMWSDGSAIAVCPMSQDAYPYDFRGLVQHEAGGHGFGKLGDEYIYTNGFIQNCSCTNPHVAEFNAAKSYGWFDNLSLSGNMNDVPWSHLIYHPTYSNIVDMYEGGYYHTRGVYRSEATSCMNNNIPYFSAISRESIVKRIMKYANVPFSQDEFYEKDVLDAGSRVSQQPWTTSGYTNYFGASKQYAPKLINGKPMLK